ncbi:MAG TPA: hypothetical protein VD699_03925 [Nitrosopumilaceae archaeon]|nr:hypothetical protein [Nitrosopumilaceae archaeon]
MESLVSTTIVIILITAFISSFTSFLQTSWEASELLFYGKSSFKMPSVIYQEEKTKFSIKFFYEQGPYTLTELKPIIDVYPESAASHVSIETEPTDLFLHTISSGTIHGTIMVNSTIPTDKIFLVTYFTARDVKGAMYKSSWNDSSDPIKIEAARTAAMKRCDDIVGSKEGMPIELKYDIEGGSVIQICKSQNARAVIAKIDAKQDGKITIKIPRKMVYSLNTLECDEGRPFILMDSEEILPINSLRNKTDNVITIGFSKGIHKIEFVGTEIIPYPSPSMLCGIAMGYDSQFLPPRFQLKNGVPLEGIRCNEELELIMNSKNGKPACVRPQGIANLIKQGWTRQLSCITGNLVGLGNQTFSCFCGKGEEFVNGGYHVRKGSSLEITRKDNVSNENNQSGIVIDVFNPQYYSQYVSVWSTCK